MLPGDDQPDGPDDRTVVTPFERWCAEQGLDPADAWSWERYEARVGEGLREPGGTSS